MKFQGKIKDGKFVLSKQDIEARKAYLISLDGKDVTEEIKTFHPNRSSNQLRAWWGLFARTVKAHFDDHGWDTSYFLKLEEPTGIGISTELIKEYMYGVCPCFDGEGRRVTMSEMNTAQMATFFEDCQKFASGVWGCYIPNPDKDYKLKENSNETNKPQGSP